jgi:hypothetical protein
VLGIVNGEIVKVTDESVQKETDINTEVLGIVNIDIVKVTDECVRLKWPSGFRGEYF